VAHSRQANTIIHTRSVFARVEPIVAHTHWVYRNAFQLFNRVALTPHTIITHSLTHSLTLSLTTTAVLVLSEDAWMSSFFKGAVSSVGGAGECDVRV
jgi:Na+-translocating ferredoxin:NAD+ oxidoreductase RnfE subunit